MEFFQAHARDDGRALRVSWYLDDDPQVRFSVWGPDGVAQAAVSLEDDEAERLADFLSAPGEPRREPLTRALRRRAAAYLR